METSALFVELLVAGLGAAVWVCLLIIGACGCPSQGLLAHLESPGSWPLVLAAVYVLGVLLDAIGERIIFRPWERYARRRAYTLVKHTGVTPDALHALEWPKARDASLTCGEGMRNLLVYIRHRVRIARCAALNFALITIAACLFARRQLSLSLGEAVRLSLLGTAATGFALFAYWRLNRAFTILTFDFAEWHERHESRGSSDGPPQAAP